MSVSCSAAHLAVDAAQMTLQNLFQCIKVLHFDVRYVFNGPVEVALLQLLA